MSVHPIICIAAALCTIYCIWRSLDRVYVVLVCIPCIRNTSMEQDFEI
jgi:hypothetical protein